MRELFTNVIVNIQQAVMLNIDKVSDVSAKVHDLTLRFSDLRKIESNVEVIESDLLTIKTDISSLRANSSRSDLNLTAKFGQIDHVLERVEGTINDGMLDIGTLDSKIEDIENRLSVVDRLLSTQTDINTVRVEAHHAKLANIQEFNKLFTRVQRNEEKLENSINKLLNSISSTDVLLEALTERFDELESNTASDSSVHDLGVDIRDMATKYNNIRRSHDEQHSNLITRICSIEKALVELGAYDEQDINTPASIEMDRLDEELSKFIVDEFNK